MSLLPHKAETLEEASIRRFDRRLRRSNELRWGHAVAWAEVLDALGWCVALKTSEGGVYLSPNALDELPGTVEWERVLSQIATRAAKERRVDGEDVQVWTARTATGAPTMGAVAYALTRRETEVLRWLREGKTGPEIVVILGCGQRTVESHMAQLYRKLGVRNRAQAVLRSDVG